MRVLSAQQMREVDRRTIEDIGIPGAVLMENAGRGAAARIAARYADVFPGPVLVLAGKGNNGGDGFVIARCLLEQGWQVSTLALAERSAYSGDAALNLEVLLRLSDAVGFACDETQLGSALAAGGNPRLVVDALFGTGLSSAVRGHFAAAIAWLNAQSAAVVAVDIPSGVHADNGCVLGCAVQASLTLTFARPKIGHLVYPGAGLVGALEVVEIGIPAALVEACRPHNLWVDDEAARRLLPPRPAGGHKGTFGHLLVMGGSTGKSGAAALAADGAVRGGAGLVTLGCPAQLHDILEIKLTEPMTVPLPQVDGGLSLQALESLLALSQDKQALALGPGLGQGEETGALVRRLVRDCPLPQVIDADGLNALAGHLEIFSAREPGTTVLTPHPGEMARLAGVAVADVQQDRVAFARAFAEAHGVVLVLKGARSLTATPDGRLYINASGNPGMASGGMGDVLTGLIGAFLAQGVEAGAAAALAVYLHGRAADRLALRLGNAGLAATDLLREIPAARHELS
ncbi:NAD(P)H-hydrate dehydratase [Geoalkalibacter halelectricus]|uniref:Bifunctional NAD(P)H-hydrate repair enzyme n=1 Tax=Geoalkalibacter halelectricus TaxID=2847045 RepID=A0ABY5ZJE9_9BACT|nr:NAD(P)H-hydrate dehydratase [Geoalkalibacter halelectricus]MDO3379129.1 NAD(P)H-hydrate dehydratase [Geoalkalibacter halelectricus]UWZ79014.1 NAD(P)H-hydrate dehydratase [Geoalkalibacter halelectricus]